MRRKKCLLLLPTSYNDGTEVPPAVMAKVVMGIERAFDGVTIGEPVEGTYKMADGTTAKDKSLVAWVIVEESQVEEARAKAGRIAAILKQEALYFEVTDVEVDFVKPPPETGDES
jgi:hypothetical protein